MEDGEVLYRQIIPGGDPIWYQHGRKPIVHRSAFLPHPTDTDGLSLIQARLRSQKWAAYRLEKPEKRYRLVSFYVDDLRRHATAAGFSEFNFEPTSDQLDERYGPPYAHCVATAINRTQYKADPAVRARIMEWANSVSKSIAEQDVSGPFEPPSEDDEYRPTPS